MPGASCRRSTLVRPSVGRRHLLVVRRRLWNTTDATVTLSLRTCCAGLKNLRLRAIHLRLGTNV
nr:unnamed protein product [Callosobruchus analis]